LVFPEGDTLGLRTHLGRLLNAPDFRSDLARRGRDRVLAHYTQAEVAARTYAVYQEMASERSKRP
jgi:glycosyltransferase involved in cell wall biosynthesis